MKHILRHLTLPIIFFLITYSANAINPDKVYEYTPDSVNWNYQELKITASDNFEIITWIYEPNPVNDRNTVLIWAGSDSGNMSYTVYHAAFLANAGFTVVTFDYRGFGQSSDFDINPDYLYCNEYALDLIAVVNRVKSQFRENKLGILAQSMGTAVAVNSFEQIGKEIDFVIGEGFMSDPSLIVSRMKEIKNKDVLLPFGAVSYISKLEKITIPILVIVGTEDKHTTVQDAKDIEEKTGDNCTISTYNGGHLRGFQAEMERGFGTWFLEQINAFMQ